MSVTNCIVGSSTNRDDESSKVTRVEYWYGIESTADYSLALTSALESEITDVAQSSISWCYQYGGRRAEEAGGEAYYLDESGRRLAIMSMSSGPLDMPYTGARIDSCPQELLNKDDNCIVMKGQMSLVAHTSDDLSMSIEAIRAGIKDAMDNDSLLDPNNPKLAAITRVVYLGNSEENVLAYGVATGGNFKGVQGSNPEGDERNEIFVPVLATALVGTGIIALVLFMMRRRRKLMTQRQLDVGAAVAAASSDASTESDPVGSFHQGYYHYTKDGVRYLSQFCATCRETERQLAMGHGLETISEDEQFFEGRSRLIAANSKDLGGYHSTMDVHNCTSATCNQCALRGDVSFIPWIKQAQGSNLTESDATQVVSNTSRSRSEKSMEV